MTCSNAVSGEAALTPIWAIQDCTPCPRPGITRPGASSHSVASSIAVTAGFLVTTGRMPMPTRSRSVTASAVAARLTPAVKKLSSMIQISSAPPASSRRAKSTTSAGGKLRWKDSPTSAR